MKNKVIITIAPLGNVPTKAMNPNVPITPDEIAEDIYRCYNAGASLAHLHARDGEGKPTTSSKVFGEIMEKVIAKCNVITQISTGARGGKTMEDRAEPLACNPEMASLATGSSNFVSSVNANSPDAIEFMAKRMLDSNIKPEIEAFDVAMIGNAEFLAKRGLLKEPLHLNMVMNVPGSIKGTPKNLLHMVESLPKGSTFTVCGIGKTHVDMITMGIILGGHVRVGLEDVLDMGNGEVATNVALVERAVRIIRELGKEVATPEEARKILSL